ncbi:MAG: alpha-L-fucosidase [Acidobacteriaceae bacterium]
MPDWDPSLLADFDAKRYVGTIAGAGFDTVMQYAKSHVGLCLWQSKIGPVHANMKGHDYFGEVMEECRRHKLCTVAYYSLIYDIWNFDHHPDWRILPENGYDPILRGRPGEVCPNSPYRDQALGELRELVRNYQFDGIFLDMTFWPGVCYCPHCTARFRKEHLIEPPRIINWNDAAWRQFQRAREEWIVEFAMLVTKSIKDVRPITVCHQYSTCIFSTWNNGVPLQLREACDYLGGDFYGGPTQYSLVCKAFYGLTPTYPFVFHTSRTLNLGDFETTKPFNDLLDSTYVATLHSAANLIIDSISPEGRLNPDVYDFLGKVNARRAAYEPYLGGKMLADVAIYYDKRSMYNPADNGVHVDKQRGGQPPHLSGVEGAARILRQAHIPFGVVTNVTLDQLDDFRAVIVPNVLEMTEDQAHRFRNFVRNGGVLYASGPSSINRLDSASQNFLLEDVLGVRYKGTLGTTWTYFSPRDRETKKAIWPQNALSFPGPMIHGEALSGTQVLATVTLPFVNPQVGNCLNVRFAQIWNNPPAPAPGTNPAVVVHPFGRGKAIWLAAPIESGKDAVNSKVVLSFLHRLLPGPYHFQVDTHESVEMTLFHQPAKRRLLVSLLNMEWTLPPIAVDATVRVQVPSGGKVFRVSMLPDRKTVAFTRIGPYAEFHVQPFELLAMASVEYE